LLSVWSLMAIGMLAAQPRHELTRRSPDASHDAP
jgi:hypothetical protein